MHAFDLAGNYPDNEARVGDEFSTDLFSSSALDFIRNYESDDPFFLYVSFTAPHDPRTPLPQYDALYPRDQVEIPANFAPDHPFDNGHIYDLRDECLAPWPRTKEIIRQHLGDYYGMITHMDWAIGQIHDALASRGLLENSLVIHTADHGLAVGQHGLLGKQNMYDHSVKVPLLMMGPDIGAGQKLDALAYQHDLFATILEAAQITVPEVCDFESLWPLLRGDVTALRDDVFCSYMDFQRMLKDGQYKLIRYFEQDEKGCNRFQLFNHVEDPNELHDLAERDEYAGLVTQMSDLLEDRMKDANDSLSV